METRKSAGFSSQEDFAKTLGIPQQTYGNYESGRSFPKEEVLRKIGVTLGVSLDYLLGVPAHQSHLIKEANVNAKIVMLKKNALEAADSVEHLLAAVSKLEALNL